MDLAHIFLTAVVIFLARVEVRSTMEVNGPPSRLHMQSYYRRENCSGGNLLKIYTDQCTNGLCKAKLDGSSSKKDNKTRFRIKDTGNKAKKCIEFSNEYALKVVNSTYVAFEKLKQGCQGNISTEFQFEEIRMKKYRVYKYNNIKCLGCASCDNAALYLIDTKGDIHDRRCHFENPGTLQR